MICAAKLVTGFFQMPKKVPETLTTALAHMVVEFQFDMVTFTYVQSVAESNYL